MSKTALSINDIVSVVTMLGQALREQRERLALTPLQVSRQVNIGAKTIELVENGRTDMQLDHLLCLLFRFGMDILLPNSGTPKRPQDLLDVRLDDMRQAVYVARRPDGGSRKISLKDVSDMSGIEQGQIGKIESGDIVPRFRTFLALMQAFNIPVSFVPLAEDLNDPEKLPKVPLKPIVRRRKRPPQAVGQLAAAY